MKKHLLLLAFALMVSIKCFSQIAFEQGYFINNENQKKDCFIKNVDWRNNPTQFEYKLSQDSKTQKADIQSVKEFGIPGDFKYIRASVNIDRSSDDIRFMSADRSPIFKEEQLFLKVLVEGKASLFIYEDGSLTRFFYKMNDSEIQQLVHKYYRLNKDAVAENHYFRQQLFLDLQCQDISKNDVEGIAYDKKDLERIFVKYNICQDPGYVNLEKKQKRDYLNLTFRPGLNISSLSVKHSDTDAREADFGAKASFRLGVETEYFLPFNKNKWAVMVEPTYQYFKTENVSEPGHASGTVVTAKVDYKSIEIPVGVRYYFYLNNASSIFMNASFIYDINSVNSTIDYSWNNSGMESSLEIRTRNNMAFGAGFKYKNRYSLEARYLTAREVLSNYTQWSSDYKTFSVIIGYTLSN
ncbi:porin family protein [Botryobacter ruber]|uniref:porin family protein n=1 Tax=Botryobacter ruber TaxID=2171629 RepID=UPI000E0B8725|nr:porin family protein [Botryobacter ruber]